MRYVANIIVRNPEGAILLVREGDPRVYGLYNFPGGHAKPGESPLTCVRRELREETGLDLMPTGMIGVYRCGSRQLHVYHGRAGSGDNVTAEADDILSVEWLRLRDIAGTPEDQVLRPNRFKMLLRDCLTGPTRRRRPATL